MYNKFISPNPWPHMGMPYTHVGVCLCCDFPFAEISTFHISNFLNLRFQYVSAVYTKCAMNKIRLVSMMVVWQEGESRNGILFMNQGQGGNEIEGCCKLEGGWTSGSASASRGENHSLSNSSLPMRWANTAHKSMQLHERGSEVWSIWLSFIKVH